MELGPAILLGAFPAAAYVIGSTPFGAIIARAHGVDLRAAGSGNVGATNVGRVVGRAWGYLCFALDLLKGLGPVLAAWVLLRSQAGFPTLVHQASWLAVGCGAILGHVFSFWLRFRGGKGVATALGVVLGVFPYFTYVGLCAFGLWIAVTLVSRYVSLGSVVAAISFLPLFAAFNWGSLGALWPMGAFAVAMVAMIVARHRGNIRRLLAGTESRIGGKVRDQESD
ncbi:MAG TPA: glycerol-3-phosphate 1-O-acyltransferase PlsY [Phycisphaerae bacterium]|nr:glycerol-3-phosphate 1-O-acyltransferase PlsY [Phycisphaerae bacterium]